MGISERLKLIRDYYNISQTDFAQSLGLKQGSYSDIERGRRKGLSQIIIEGIANGYDKINIEWLLTGEGEMLKMQPKEEAKVINLTDYNVKLVPLVGQFAYAGYLNGFADTEYVDSLPTVPLIATHDPKGNYVAFEVSGDSMDDDSGDSLKHGDIIICREISHPLWQYKLHINKWNFVIVHKTDGILVKKIVDHNVNNGDIKIHSLNPMYEDSIINLSDVSKLFNVIQINRVPK